MPRVLVECVHDRVCARRPVITREECSLRSVDELDSDPMLEPKVCFVNVEADIRLSSLADYCNFFFSLSEAKFYDTSFGCSSLFTTQCCCCCSKFEAVEKRTRVR